MSRRCAYAFELLLVLANAAGCRAVTDIDRFHVVPDAGIDAGGADASFGCPALVAPTNGSVDRSTGTFDDVATYSCESGFYLLGNSASLTRTCQTSGTWTGADPTCESTKGYPLWPMPGTPNHPRDYQIATDTVLDRVTGLEWQRAVDPGTFSWTGARAYCADLVLDGKTDWRLPTRIELASIVDYTRFDPSIDPSAFPSTPLEQHWSTSPSAAAPDFAYFVSFANGTSFSTNATSCYRARCVRGTSVRTDPVTHFTVNGDGTVAQTTTGLLWQRTVSAPSYTQADGSTYCAGLSLSGGGWRLPHAAELYAMLDETLTSPAIDPAAFPSAPSTTFWSATPMARTAGDAWFVSFDAGHVGGTTASSTFRVRCVR